jgi:hypothetical protein
MNRDAQNMQIKRTDYAHKYAKKCVKYAKKFAKYAKHFGNLDKYLSELKILFDQGNFSDSIFINFGCST